MEELKINFDESRGHSAVSRFFHPERWTFRYTGLALMCYLGFGAYYCYDSPGALLNYFTSNLHMSTNNFALLYSVYSWPNTFLCFFAGFLIDKVFKVRLGTILYTSITAFGHLLFAVGVYADTFWVMLVGRFIYGIGVESLIVAQTTYVVLWFKGKELNMVLGPLKCFFRLGSTCNFLVTERIYSFFSKTGTFTDSQCICIVLFLSAVPCIGSVICAVLLGLMDKRAERILGRNKETESKVVTLGDVRNFNYLFWLISWVAVSFAISVIPFISFGKMFFMTKYQLEPAAANAVNSLVYSVSVGTALFIGIAIDKTGDNNIRWVLLGISAGLVGHVLLAFTYVSPYIGTILLGIAYSIMASALFPMIAMVIPNHYLGTAYGAAQSQMNLGLAIAPLICGLIISLYGYFILETFFISWLCVCMVIAIVIWKFGRKSFRKDNFTQKRSLSLEKDAQTDAKELEKLQTVE